MQIDDLDPVAGGSIDSVEKRQRLESRPFPTKSLADALKVVQAIKDKNAGKPLAPEVVADAIGRKPRSSDFQRILSASQGYGLTEGGSKATTINLTELGRQLAYPKDQKDEIDRLFEAFMNVELFRQIFDHYKGNKIPEEKYFKNTIEHAFKVIPSHQDDFISIFDANCRFLGATSDGILQSPIEKASVVESTLENVAVVRSGRVKAFVIMPFVEKNPERVQGFFKEVYKSLIEPAASAAGFDVDWANKPGSDIIQSTIINEILDADILIADLTDHNPNVLFELGMRLAYNKGPTALIKSADTGRLFDVDNLIRVYEYRPSLWRSTLETDIPNMEQHFRATWANKDNNETYLNILRKRAII